MNTKLAVILGVVVLVAGGGIYYRSLQHPTPKSSQPSSLENMEYSSGATAPATATTSVESGGMQTSRYMSYSETAFESSADKKRVLFFHAPWCPTCRPADAAFQNNSANIPEDVVLFKTDYDSSGALKKKYGITYQHTFVQVDEDGREVTKWNGGDIRDLIANIK